VFNAFLKHALGAKRLGGLMAEVFACHRNEQSNQVKACTKRGGTVYPVTLLQCFGNCQHMMRGMNG
jgi:hypothetical protein